MITAHNIIKSIPVGEKNLVILKGVTLSIQKGEIVAIIGASGVGKSTFLHILGALDRPTAGSVLFHGLDLFSQTDQGLSEFRNRKVGFVFQSHHLLSEFTALENTMMPGLIQRVDPGPLTVRAKEILSAMGLSERFNHRPGQLSGGEQQRVAIARALILHPELVLADEPTGNLDSQTGEEVFALLKGLNRQMNLTLVLVTHNEKLSLQADRIVKMVDGTLEHPP